MFLSLLLLAAQFTFVIGVTNPIEYVNVLGGTDSLDAQLSRGSSLPMVVRPWGFNGWAPYTTGDGNSWWFHPKDRKFYGIRCTHQPSPWIADYGHFVLRASMPSVLATDKESNDYSSFTPSQTTFTPYLFKTALTAYETTAEDTTIEFTSTQHGGIMRATFPTYVNDSTSSGFDQTRRITVGINGDPDTAIISTDYLNTLSISGMTSKSSGGTSKGFEFYFIAAIFTGEKGDVPVTTADSRYTDSSWAFLDFSPHVAGHDKFTVRLSTSFISLDQALLNLKSEVGLERSFESIVEESKADWNNVLSRVNIEEISSTYSESEQSDLLTTFYSSLFRASLFPRQLSETDVTGQLVHWSPYDNQVHPGDFSTDSGFWDAYNTVYPLLTLINTPRLATTIRGWLNAYTEGGWLPTWSSPGWRGSMVGTMGDVSLGDAIVKKIPGFDVELAYEAIRKDAFEVPPTNTIGRECLTEYINLGYVSRLCASESTSRTLNYYQSDYAIAQAARTLDKTSDYEQLSKRYQKFDKIFDKETGFFRPVFENGSFPSEFDQYAWGGDYTEAGPWQFRFYLPWNPTGLSDLYASAGFDMCAELQIAQTIRPVFHIGGYGSLIHEMTEMGDVGQGQYAHNNQPSHHMLWMFGAIDPKGYTGECASKGQYWIRRILSTQYKPTADMYSGDEDNGEMAAWYVLGSLGLYEISPGSTDYAFGSPLFQKVTLSMDDGTGTTKPLVITARNNAKANVYVHQVLWNGKLLEGVNSIAYDLLRQGGELTFVMGAEPLSGSKKFLRQE